ncbi:CLUMA_CG010131, isoform A [Clunio marinus]|uniref:CLUMA_CG010131, isoform A n=1 Tax=Clunio marinus TaxID=568069 RepID=A0A1J1IB04_9DIPT|nr:CLUMA_CG010131, isoform A [Clunio marinus]
MEGILAILATNALGLFLMLEATKVCTNSILIEIIPNMYRSEVLSSPMLFEGKTNLCSFHCEGNNEMSFCFSVSHSI